MNWIKALDRLILLFFVVNLLLGFANYEKHLRSFVVKDKQIEHITHYLNRNDIKIEAQLPKTYRPLGRIFIEAAPIQSDLREEIVSIFLKENKDAATITVSKDQTPYESEIRSYHFQNQSLSFGRDHIIYRDEAIDLNSVGKIGEKQAKALTKDVLDLLQSTNLFKKVKSEYKIESYGAKVTYYEVYEGIPIFNSFITFQVTPKGIASMHMERVEVVGQASEIEPIFAVDQVLFGLAGLIQSDQTQVIEKIELGYGMKNNEGMTIFKEEAIPMYKVDVLGLDKSIFVNAYTNEIEND